MRTTQLRNDLIYRMLFLTHLKESFPGLRLDKILSLQLDQFWVVDRRHLIQHEKLSPR